MIVQPDFPDHWKTQMLIGLTQDKASPLMMIRLWGHCQLRKTHVFNDLTPNALKSICRWDGEPDALMVILLECGFIKKNSSQIVVHQWDEVNSFLVRNWVNGAKGGRPKEPKHNPKITQAEPIDKIREDKIREDNEEGSPNGSPNPEVTMNQKQSEASQATEPSNLILSLKKKKRTKTVYPAKHDLLKLWSLDYPAAHGGDSYHYVETKDDKPVDDLLSRYSPAQIMERAQKGWESQKQFIRDNASTFYGLNRYWNEIGNETRGSSKPVPKLRKLESL